GRTSPPACRAPFFDRPNGRGLPGSVRPRGRHHLNARMAVVPWDLSGRSTAIRRDSQGRSRADQPDYGPLSYTRLSKLVSHPLLLVIVTEPVQVPVQPVV